MIAHYLQGITKHFSLGSELLFQKGAARQQAIVTFAGKYKSKTNKHKISTVVKGKKHYIIILCFTADDWSLAGTLGSGGMHASFFRKANEHYQVGVEMEASLKTWDSVTTLAFQCDAPKLNMLFKGMPIL